MSTNAVVRSEVVGFRAARRVNASLTAAVEKRVLGWMAERAPAWVTSDQLTLLGLLAQIGGGICYALAGVHRPTGAGPNLCSPLRTFGSYNYPAENLAFANPCSTIWPRPSMTSVRWWNRGPVRRLRFSDIASAVYSHLKWRTRFAAEPERSRCFFLFPRRPRRKRDKRTRR